MSDLSDAFMEKAAESLAGARSEFGNGRYNNTANRAYYAAFQAAIAALDDDGIHPLGDSTTWGHGFVHGQFTGLLINRRKRYPAELRGTLQLTFKVRQQGDYKLTPVTVTQARQVLARANALVEAVNAHV